MTEIRGRTAFITGGASGLGLAMAKAILARGGSVMLADINAEGLAQAERILKEAGGEVASVACNVTDLVSVKAAAQATVERFGRVHTVVNNAGVSMTGKTGKIAMENWRWVVDINLLGVVHGVEVFTPIIRSHGEGGHILNTASIAGHVAGRGAAPYHATKFAVVGYSESLQDELKSEGIEVSVLCPAFVRTNIVESEFDRPSISVSREEGRKTERFQRMKSVIEAGLDADAVGEWVAECIEANRFYIFTHRDMLNAVTARYEAIVRDYQAIIDDGRFD